MLSHGITSFQEALVRETNLEVYKSLYGNQEKLWKLPRASLSLWPSQSKNRLTYPIENKGILYSNNKLKINSVKVLLDGVMESKTAYLHEPYICNCNEQLTNGQLNLTMDEVNTMFEVYDKEGKKMEKLGRKL